MNKVAIVDYLFVFEKGLFSNVYEFENLFIKFLNEKGMEAENMEYVEGQKGKRTIYIAGKPEVVVSEPVKAPKTPKQQIDSYRKSPIDPRKKK